MADALMLAGHRGADNGLGRVGNELTGGCTDGKGDDAQINTGHIRATRRARSRC